MYRPKIDIPKIDLYGWLILIITFVVVLFFAMTAPAQWEEVPEAGTTIDFGGTANADAQAFTGQAIHAGKKYWAGVQANQINADGEVKTQDLAARLQGGFDFYGVSLQGFIEAERDTQSEFTTATGAYFRGIVAVKKLDFIIGIGSFVEREQVRAELGLDETAPTTLPYWLWSIGTDYNIRDNVGLHAQVLATPEGRFRHWKGTAHFGVDIILGQNLTLKLQSTNNFSTHGEDLTIDTENSALVSINF